MDAIPELASRGEQKIQPAREVSAQRKYEKLSQLMGILLHTARMAIQNI